MEDETSKLENILFDKFDQYIDYTFTQIRRPNRSSIMARLKNKEDMEFLWKALQETFQNTPLLSFWIGPWNPAELYIPDPAHMKISIEGESVISNNLYASYVKNELRQADVFPNIWSDPKTGYTEEIRIKANRDRWHVLEKNGLNFSYQDLMDIIRVTTEGKSAGDIIIDGENYPLRIKYPDNHIKFKEDIEAYPLVVFDKVLPLKSLADVSIVKAKPSIYRVNGQDIIYIKAKRKKGEESLIQSSNEKAKKIIEKIKKSDHTHLNLKEKPVLSIMDANIELNKAIKELITAVVLSLILIMITIFFQFGNIIHTAIIMLSIPLGLIGGILSLWVFGSTLSLNSILGIILLNGISVNNSIILVDFILKEFKNNVDPVNAAINATKLRLRPILITSLTTILGMLPIALGLGEGGKVLKPLGVVVASGLWISTLFTLFVIPFFEVYYLNYLRNKKIEKIDADQEFNSDSYLEENIRGQMQDRT